VWRLEQIGGRLVGEHHSSVLVHHGDRLGEIDEDRLQALLDMVQL